MSSAGKIANAKSPVSLMLLGVKEGEAIRLKVKGDDAAEAIERVAAFLGASEKAAAPSPSDQRKRVGARLAIGPAHPFFIEDPAEEPGPADPKEIDGNLDRFRKARAEALASIERRREKASGEGAAILRRAGRRRRRRRMGGRRRGAHRRARSSRVRHSRGGARARRPLRRAGPHMWGARRRHRRSRPARGDDRVRADPGDLGQRRRGRDRARRRNQRARPLRARSQQGRRAGQPQRIADQPRRDHRPRGGAPAIFGCALPRETLLAARMVAIDAAAGVVRVDPDERVRAEFRDAIAAAAKDADELNAFSRVRPVTCDGRAIVVAANIGSPGDIDAARAVGAMGVGLFRTEFLFLNRPTLPDENEQYEAYAEVAAAFAPDPVVIRTLDIGGDKPLRAAPGEREDNPFLGCRGVRLCLDRPEISGRRFAPCCARPSPAT